MELCSAIIFCWIYSIN